MGEEDDGKDEEDLDGKEENSKWRREIKREMKSTWIKRKSKWRRKIKRQMKSIWMKRKSKLRRKMGKMKRTCIKRKSK